MDDAVAVAADCDRRTPRVTVSTQLLAVFTFKQEAQEGRKEKRRKKTRYWDRAAQRKDGGGSECS